MDYTPLTYSVSVMGRDYDLPPRTIAVDAKIEDMSRLDGQYWAGKLTRLEVLTRMYNFAREFAPGALPPLEEVDVNELNAACVNIVEAYTVDIRKERLEAKADELKDALKKAVLTAVRK